MVGERLTVAFRYVRLECSVCGCVTVLPYYAGLLCDFPCAGCDAEWGMVLDERGKVLGYDHPDWPPAG